MTMIIRSGVVYGVNPPLKVGGVDVISYAFNFKSELGTVIYVPFDPYTYKIPLTKGEYKEREFDNYKIVYSPNVWEVMMKYYSHKETKNGEEYLVIDNIPILLVDYGTPVGANYYGTNEPKSVPIEEQYNTWKSGYMMSRVHMPNSSIKDLNVTACTSWTEQWGCLDFRKLKIAEGWWWVKYEAKLMIMPPAMMTADRQVLKFYYKRVNTVLEKVPGVTTVINWVEERELSGTGVQKLRSMLRAFGLDIDYNYEYKTDSGKMVTGPHVEAIKDGYVVYLPVVRTTTVASLDPAAIPMAAIYVAAIIIAIGALAVAFAYIADKIVSNVNKNVTIPIKKVINAQENLNNCIKECDNEYNTEYNQLLQQYNSGVISKSEFETGVNKIRGEHDKCCGLCKKSYADVVNTIQKAQKEGNNIFSNISSSISGFESALKWLLVVIIVVSLIRVVSRR